MRKVFIDGSAGTTGLRIFDRLAERDDIELIKLSEENRKDTLARKDALNSADIAFLCLPDAAAIEAVSLVENPDTVIIDTSTAHRTDSNWAYGLPELSKSFYDKIKSTKRISVPGCHASGFVSLVYPLVESGALAKSALLTCHSLTGYSGGGKSMIADYEKSGRAALLNSPRQYGITQNHKHLKEMKAITELETAPIFCPIVSDYYSGMEVTVPLFKSQLSSGFDTESLKDIYRKKYDGIIRYVDSVDEGGLIAGNALAGMDLMKITISGNEERILLVALFDNLGKGASGAAVECMNLSMGVDKTKGLVL